MSKLADYIKKELKKGFSEKEIKNALLKAGHPKEKIEMAFEEVEYKDVSKHKHPSPKFWLMLAGILAVILITGLIFYNLVARESAELEKCRKLENINERHLCLKGIKSLQLQQAYSATPCDSIENADEKNICMIKFAKENNNTTFCSGVSNISVRFECMTAPWRTDECSYKKIIREDADECYAKLAAEEKNPYLCYSASNAIECKAKASIELDDYSFCGREMRCMARFINAKYKVNICQEPMDVEKCAGEIRGYVDEY